MNTATITNRDLLRYFKDLKSKLTDGELEEIRVPQSDGSILKVTLEKPKTNTQLLLEKIEKRPLHSLTRPDVDLFE